MILGFGMRAVYSRIGARGALRHGVIVAFTTAYTLWLRGWLAVAEFGPPRGDSVVQTAIGRSSVAPFGRNVE